MSFLILKTLDNRFQNVNFEFEFSYVFIRLLQLVLSKIKFILSFAVPLFVIIYLLCFYSDFSLVWVQFFFLKIDPTLIFGFCCFQFCYLLYVWVHFLRELFICILKDSHFIQNSFIPSFQVSMYRVHIIQFTFKLQSQLNLFFVVFRVLHVLFLQFESHLSLKSPLFF